MAVTSFIPELWSARLLAHLDKAHVATAFTNRDYEGEIRQAGDTVHINTLGNITVKSYTKNTDIEGPEALSTEDQTLVIDQLKYFNFQVDDVDKVQAAGALLDPATQRAAYALSDTADAFIFNYLASAAKKQITLGSVTNVNTAYAALVAIRTAFVQANVPSGTWQVAVDPVFSSFLLKDERFVKAGIDAQYGNLQNGFIGRAAGMDIYESNNVGSGKIIACPAFACTFAEQILEMEAYRPEKRFADAVKGLHVYGIKATYPECIIKGTFTDGTSDPKVTGVTGATGATGATGSTGN